MTNDKVTIIGIAGGTGSGKTTVVKKIVEALPPHHVAVVPGYPRGTLCGHRESL